MHVLTRLVGVGLCAAATASAVQAQNRRSVQPAPNNVPSASTRAAQSAPNPAGLRPVFPAGISSGSGAAVSSDPIASSTSPVPPGGTTATPSNTTIVGSGVGSNGNSNTTADANAAAAAATTVMGAGATARGPGQATGGAGGFSATDIARSFYFADANHDGELTRSEAGRLSIRSLSFEEMDRNYDGIISRFEYDDSVR